MPLRVDLGRIFPGIIILMAGIMLLILWIIVAIVSFFISVNFYMFLALLIVALGCIAVGIIQIFRGLSGLRGRSSKGPGGL